MRLILEGEADDVQSAIILIALRMKRETDLENTGVLQALMEGIEPVALATERLCVLADPFNGFTRSLPAGPFVPAVLAACGTAALTHGALAVGPKFGLTHRHVLEAAGVPCLLSVGQAQARLNSSNIGWAYLDQSVGVPELAALTTLRRRIVKRPCLTTLESGVTPMRAARYTHLVTGFVHKAYPPVYRLMAKVAGFDGTSVVKGVEGGIVPTLTHESRLFQWSAVQGDSEAIVNPGAMGVETQERCVPLPPDIADTTGRHCESQLVSLAAHTATLGLDALNGQRGTMYDSIRLSSALALAGVNAGDSGNAADTASGPAFGNASGSVSGPAFGDNGKPPALTLDRIFLDQALELVDEALASGKAASFFQAGIGQ